MSSSSVENSFEGVEALQGFTDLGQLNSYRQARLSQMRLRSDWLVELVTRSKSCSILDIGAGSSALLYSAEESGKLSYGIAIEPALSRHVFAEKWKEDCGFQKVTNLHGYFDDVPITRTVDLVSCLDNTLSYILAQDVNGAISRLLVRAGAWLVDDGFLVIEVLDYGRRPLWKKRVEMEQSDRFLYAEYLIKLQDDGTVYSESVYLPRNKSSSIKKVDAAAYVPPAKLMEELKTAGFIVHLVPDALPWVGLEDFPRTVIVARKCS